MSIGPYKVLYNRKFFKLQVYEWKKKTLFFNPLSNIFEKRYFMLTLLLGNRKSKRHEIH